MFTVAGRRKLGLKNTRLPGTSKAKEHNILIASSYPFEAGPFPPELSPLHLMESYFSDIYLGFELTLIAVHFP